MKRILPLSLSLLSLTACQNDQTRERTRGQSSTLSADNGSWGNGSWGNGAWGNGSWGNGTWGNGTWGNGTWGNGTWGNGSWGNGTWGNGTWGNGTWGNGTWGNGTWGNGTWGNGTWGNGTWGNGSWGNGTWGNGMLFGTLDVADLDISNLVDASLTGVACGSDPDTSVSMTEFMVYVAAIQCALPAPCPANDEACMSQLDCNTNANCRTITDCDGNELYVAGRDGLGTNQSDPAVVASVDSCIDNTLAQLNTEFRAYADNLNHYAASCALPESDGGDCSADPGCVEVTYQMYPSGTETKQYYGAIGLAPSWKNNPDFDVDPAAQRRVSACLASRTNPDRKKVQLSIRGMNLDVGEVEKHHFSQHEGAFWGNLFGASPSISTCRAAGGGISGRVCTNGNCGFTDRGLCTDICSQDADGNFINCDGVAEVLNTFLPFAQNVSSGDKHTCMMRAEGRITCFGRNKTGQLGDGTTTDSVMGVDAVGITDPAQIVTGRYHSCARQADGRVFCWGDNYEGQIGDGSNNNRLSPVEVTSLGTDVAQLSAGGMHTCAILTNGTLHCWGKGSNGLLGNGSTGDKNQPVLVPGLSQISRVAGGQTHTCAIQSDGTLWCWGKNTSGEIGVGTQDVEYKTPQLVPIDPVKDICLGNSHTCALRVDNSVECWGMNTYGQVGNGEILDANSPQSVALQGPARSLSCGRYHTCAALDDGSAWCWGRNDDDQLGSGSGSAHETSPTQVTVTSLGTPLPAVEEVIVGGHSSFARAADGALFGWGRNRYGQLALSTTDDDDVSAPTRVQPFDVCGDNLCEVGETITECPSDCSACGGGVCAP